MTEEWRDIPGHEGYYQVSSLGQVRSLDRDFVDSRGHQRSLAGRVLSPRKTGKNYRTVHLGDRERDRKVHQLVLAAFVGPVPEGQEVRHLDGDPTNNRLDNLLYGTRSENRLDSVRHGTHNAASRTHCPRRHALAAPNLVRYKKSRACLACVRASKAVGASRRGGRPVPDIDALADIKYAQIMGHPMEAAA